MLKISRGISIIKCRVDPFSKKDNKHLFRHAIKFPVKYVTQKVYKYKTKERMIYRFGRHCGKSYLFRLDFKGSMLNDSIEAGKERIKEEFKRTPYYKEMLELIIDMVGKFNKTIIPVDLLNPIDLIDEKVKEEELTLVINWFASDNIHHNEDPNIFILNIFKD